MTRHSARYRTRGFTLLEITIVLFIVGLLIAGLLAPLETQLESRDRRQTIETLNQIADALYGYAITNGRLPCPDKDDTSSGGRDGHSDPAFDPTNTSTAVCSVTVGLVPYTDLGVPPGDAWGNRIRYAVTSPNYTRPEADGLCNGNSLPDPHFDLCTKGKLKINTRGDNPATGPQESKFLTILADEIPAVLISHGRNGFGATTIAGTVLPPPSGNDETENSDNDGTFISRGYSKGSSACTDDNNESTPLCEFDDIVVWLSPTILNAKMVSAGRLP